MSDSIFSRLSGPIVLGTGVLLILAELILTTSYDAANRVATVHNPAYLAGGVIYLLAFGGLLISLAAAHQRQAEAAGLLGLVGFAAAIVGTLFLAGDLWFETFAVPWLGDVAPDVFTKAGGMLMVGGFASYVLFATGWTLFGLASLRARVFPMAVSLTIVAGGVIGFQALIPPFGLPLGVAITSLGVWMSRRSFGPAKGHGSLAAAAILAVAVLATGCSGLIGTRGDGPITAETRQAEAFTRIEAGFGIAVTVTIGPAQPLEVHAQANILPIIATDVQGGTLLIRGTREFNTAVPVEVAIVTPTLDAISLSGGSHGHVAGLAADRLEIQLSGGADLAASGSAADVELTSSGGSQAHLSDLSTQTVSLELSGGATAAVNASDQVKGSAAGGSHASVRGAATLNVTSSGGAEVTHE
jgi:hypothetical protein